MARIKGLEGDKANLGDQLKHAQDMIVCLQVWDGFPSRLTPSGVSDCLQMHEILSLTNIMNTRPARRMLAAHFHSADVTEWY